MSFSSLSCGTQAGSAAILETLPLSTALTQEAAFWFGMLLELHLSGQPRERKEDRGKKGIQGSQASFMENSQKLPQHTFAFISLIRTPSFGHAGEARLESVFLPRQATVRLIKIRVSVTKEENYQQALLLLLLLSCFSHVRLCATPQTIAHQAPPSLGFSRQEH